MTMQILVRNAKASLCLLALSLWFVPGAQAQDEEEKRGWYFSADLSYVLTAGNAEASTIGLGLKADRYWERSRLKLAARGIRVESALKTRTAVGSSQDDFQLVEEKNTETTAENYFAGAKYDWDVAEVLFLFGSADWVRNTFAGVESRVVMTAPKPVTDARSDGPRKSELAPVVIDSTRLPEPLGQNHHPFLIFGRQARIGPGGRLGHRLSVEHLGEVLWKG